MAEYWSNNLDSISISAIVDLFFYCKNNFLFLYLSFLFFKLSSSNLRYVSKELKYEGFVYVKQWFCKIIALSGVSSS